MQPTVVASFARPRFLQEKWLLALVAGVAGFAVNGFGLPVFGGTSLVFGGVLSLLSAFALGPGYGAAAAAIAFSRTIWEWHDPAGLVCATLEALIAGWLIHRRQWRPLGAVAVFWLCFGFPIATVWTVGYSSVPFPTDWAIALKLPVNGLVAALVASPLHQLLAQSRPELATTSIRQPASLRRMLFQRFGTIAALPLVALSFLAGHQFDQARRDASTAQLDEWLDDIIQLVGRHVELRERAVSNLARDLAREAHDDPASLQRELDHVRRDTPGFLGLLVADPGGKVVVATSSGRPPPPAANSGGDVSDRNYFRVPLATGQPYVSEVFRSRGPGNDLVVAVSAPVLDSAGRVKYVVEGSLDLGAVAEALATTHAPGHADLVIVDQTQRVILARGAFALLPALTQFVGNSLYDAARRSGSRIFYHNAASPDRRGQEVHLAAHATLPRLDWQLYAQIPMWDVQRPIAIFYLTTLCWAAAGVGLALVIARLTADSLTKPLSGLLRATHALSTSSATPVVPTLDTAGAPIELAQLSHDVHMAAVRLRRSNLELEVLVRERERANAQLRELAETLDAKVAERTAELQQARSAAESASLAKSDFLASMSHELRTPLNVIIGMTELMREQSIGPVNDRQEESLRSVEESGRHLLALIGDILDLSKVEAGKVALDLQPISVRDACEASLRLVRDGIEKKNLSLGVDYKQRSPVVTADPRRLKQILVNLLTNAVKFTPDGGRIGLTVTQTDQPPALHFAVWDTGIGISPEDQDRLFQRFVQIDSALARRHSGTGLGLVLVKRLTQLHQGQVAVESKVGAGSRFTITLPLTAEQARVEPEPIAHLPESSASSDPNALAVIPPIPGSPLILLAEDNPANVAVIEGFAQMRRCRLILAGNGLEAIARARLDHPDIILMDVGMPEMDGLEATRQLTADPRTRRIPIVCVTAGAMAGDRAKCFAAGASAYVSKPVDLKELAATIVRLLPAGRPPPVAPTSLA